MVGVIAERGRTFYPRCLHCKDLIWGHIHDRCLYGPNKYEMGDRGWCVDWDGVSTCDNVDARGWVSLNDTQYMEVTDDTVFWAHYLTMRGHKW